MLKINPKQMRRCVWLGLLASVLVLAVNLTIPDIFCDWEIKTFDYRMRARGQIKTNPNIILIDIDDRSINNIGRWPWARSIHARMIEILSFNKAHTIAYDILFHQPSDKIEDGLLIKATAESERLYYPVGFDFIASNISGTKSSEENRLEYLKAYGLGRFIGDTKGILSVKRAITPIEQISDVAGGLGHISSNRDGDGIIRRVPLVVEMDGVLFPSFALSAVMDYLNVPKDTIIIKPGKSITLKGALFPEEKRRRDIVIPIDDKGMMLINYAGIWTKTFHHYSFKNILNTFDASDNEEASPDFNDNIILVSNVASGYDIKPIPLENNYPGGGIHANIINTILTENFLKEANLPIKIIIIVLLGLIGALSGLFIKWHLKAISLLALLLGYIMLSFYVFKSLGVVLQVISPTITLLFGSIFVSFHQTQSERSAVLDLSEQKHNLEAELQLISNKLTEKEEEITGILAKLTGQDHHHIPHPQLKEKLRVERDKKESLTKKKIMILRRLSPFASEELRRQAKKFHIITGNRELLEAVDLAKRVAPTDHGVLLLGESGTGKELFARAIHAMSRRNQRELITVNVASIVLTLAESELFGHIKGAFAGADRNREGLFQKADIGTIFLDEIGDLHPDVQAKLLRVLQDGEVRQVGSSKSFYTDVRVIAATDKNLEMEVRAGRFNKALFARLNRYPIILPTLRERIEDIPYLVEEFIKRHREERDISGISQKAIEVLGRYQWPENVRQLENVIIRAIVNTQNKELHRDDIQYAIEQESYSGYKRQDKVEDKINIDIGDKNSIKREKSDHPGLLYQLRENRFNINETAKVLNMSRNTVTDHFKGICFKYLVEHGGNIKDAALSIAGNSNFADKVERKINRYYKNLLSAIKDCQGAETAKKKCGKIFKNIPREYSRFIEKIIDQDFKPDIR